MSGSASISFVLLRLFTESFLMALWKLAILFQDLMLLFIQFGRVFKEDLEYLFLLPCQDNCFWFHLFYSYVQ